MVILHDTTIQDSPPRAPPPPPKSIAKFQQMPVNQYETLFATLNAELTKINMKVKSLHEENINLENANTQLLHEMSINRDNHRADIKKLNLIVDGLVERLDNADAAGASNNKQRQPSEPQPSCSGEQQRMKNKVMSTGGGSDGGGKRKASSEDEHSKLYDVVNLPSHQCPPFPELDLWTNLGEAPKESFSQINLNTISVLFDERKAGGSESNGRRLLHQKFLKNIFVATVDEFLFLKCFCSAEMRKNVDHQPKVVFSKLNGHLVKAECSCSAGTTPNAACKHVSALAYAIEHYNITGKY